MLDAITNAGRVLPNALSAFFVCLRIGPGADRSVDCYRIGCRAGFRTGYRTGHIMSQRIVTLDEKITDFFLRCDANVTLGFYNEVIKEKRDRRKAAQS